MISKLLEAFAKGLLRCQGLSTSYANARLNVNELRSVVRLLETVAGKEARMRAPQLRAAKNLPVPSLDARLLPAHHCVHALTAPRPLLQRSAVFPPNPSECGVNMGWTNWSLLLQGQLQPPSVCAPTAEP